MSMDPVLNYINGSFHEPYKGEWLDTINPATNQVLAKVPVSCQEDVDKAVRAAAKAFPSWRDTSIDERAEHLFNLAKALEAEASEFARLESLDNGKPVWLADSVDIPRSVQNLQFFAEAIKQWGSESHHGSQGLNYTLRQPRGVAVCISPWNLPLYLFTWKVCHLIIFIQESLKKKPTKSVFYLDLIGKIYNGKSIKFSVTSISASIY